MPRGNFKSESGRSSSDDADDVRAEGSRRSSRRTNKVVMEVFSGDERVDSVTEVHDDSYEDNPVAMSSEEDELEAESSDSDDELKVRTGSKATRGKRSGKPVISLRSSSRSNKFTSSLKEPSVNDGNYIEVASFKRSAAASKPPTRKNHNSKSSTDEETDWSEDDEQEASFEQRHAKSPVRHSATNENHDDKEYKVQRLLACRTETRSCWKEICINMNTTEIHRGSRWYQDGDENVGDEEHQRQERFLVKWAGLSFLHCSWETRDDILGEIEGSQRYFTTFAQRNENGLAYSADERMDGDYFDPAFIEVDRILSVTVPKGRQPSTAEEEDEITPADYGIVTDSSNAGFERGKGRLFLIKWRNTPYSDITTECERDLIIKDVEYKEKLKEFLRRRSKPTKAELSQLEMAGRTEYGRLMVFRSRKGTDESKRENAAKAYQAELQEQVYKNEGRLRDYQAEGVAWLLSNYVNRRSSLLADEMGLGKTIQTAAFVNIVAMKLNRPGPILVVVPLSTAANWMREFQRWTELNTILYHGSANDRRIIRELEMAYEADRPKSSAGSNQSFLSKCNSGGSKSPQIWMAQVVVTTPEMIIADDAGQLSHIRWELLIVDECHRMKSDKSKVATGLRDAKFQFNHKILLTGTPIQNEIKEFWALLSFIDPDEFGSEQDFLSRYGDLTVKDSIDDMHERIRPYILRRLKEDVETSVPPKEETLIEVELSLVQKQYYRAIFEKNVQFLCKKKGQKAVDGPSLLNLHMELRKCCNHPFLIKGAEQAVRDQHTSTGEMMSEGDFLVRSSGKLILLDKLLPRLKSNGHRCLIFSQFKIMLDILEDYLSARSLTFERIDGSITGNKRQQAIDRFQALPTDNREPPFIMLLSTRAGGVGINLTAADTCIIFDSDFNPQNDLQAQSRCHRIGQTKSVKVYRLLSAKTYEMKLFHMSSLKMGLDQAVLNGFESNGGDTVMSKDEMERLLRHGAYDIFNEVKAGTAEAESRAFVEQDIDTILERRSRTVIHENTGSQSNSKGGTFSKARFAASSEAATGNDNDEVDIDDEMFWEKVVGYNPNQNTANDLPEKRRRRTAANYVEVDDKKINDPESGDDAFSYHESVESPDDTDVETAQITAPPRASWQKKQMDKLLKLLLRFGYGMFDWHELVSKILVLEQMNETETKRMASSLFLLALLEVALEEAAFAKKRAFTNAIKKRKLNDPSDPNGIEDAEGQSQADLSFQKIWAQNCSWAQIALKDALIVKGDALPRPKEIVNRIRGRYLRRDSPKLEALFAAKVWPMLMERGWKVDTDTKEPGVIIFFDKSKTYRSMKSVVEAVTANYPDLVAIVEPISSEMNSIGNHEPDDISGPTLTLENVGFSNLSEFLFSYAPIEALLENGRRRRVGLGRKSLEAFSCLWEVKQVVRQIESSEGDIPFLDRLIGYLPCDFPSARPHPGWNVRHDAVLIHAVATHGWIEREETGRAISSDTSIEWGRPFDRTGSLLKSKLVMDALRGTAERAAIFLTVNCGVLDDLNGFDLELISKVYGLTKSVDFAGSHSWVVESASLVKSFEESTVRGSRVLELPSRKELGKRIKALCPVITEGAFRSTSTTSNEPHREQAKSYGFCVLDQNDPCNVLLAEILRALLKMNLQENKARFLVSLAYDEASKRHDEIMKLSTDETASAVKNDMEMIIQHIVLVQRSVKATRQSKNVLRVLLGKEPLPSRKSDEGLFPPDEVKTSERKKTHKAIDGTTSDRAMTLGLVRAIEGQSSMKPCDFQLTALEALLLGVVSSLGLPVWDGHDQRNVATETAHNLNSFTLSWASLCDVADHASKDWLSNAQDKLDNLRAALDRVREMPEDSVEKANAERMVTRAEREVKLKQIAASQSVHYASNPEALAKKVTMLVEKLRTRMGSIGSTPSTKKRPTAENSLGPKVLAWLGKEVSRWGNSLQCVDGQGCVFAYSASDFADDATAEEVEAIAVFDQKACRHVFGQIAMLTRLRSVFMKYGNYDIRMRVSKAVNNSANAGEVWEKQPEWWTKSAEQNDFSLLENLLTSGFSGVLFGNGTFRCDNEEHSKEIMISESGLTKVQIQKRANQLTRELHAMEETLEVMQMVSQRRNRGSTKAAASLPAPIVVPELAGIQTGIQAFFAAGKDLAFKPEKEVIALSDADSDVEMMPKRPASGKRKDEGQSPEVTSPEKKIRTT